MNKQTSVGLTALAASVGFAATALATPLASQSRPYDSSLSKLGKAITYPIKKGAGNGSKAANHGGKAIQYPVRKAGVNTSKTTHKVLPK
jgi:hypothetical protein